MSSQEEYGVSDSTELVPTGLRVYRHYRIQENGILYPATASTWGILEPGVNQAVCHRVTWSDVARIRPGKRNCKECYGYGYRVERRYRARPVGANPWVVNDDAGSPLFSQWAEDVEVACTCAELKCKAPDALCACGFYASYSPETDFFGNPTIWGVMIPTVFAVVEASGRVLMGSKGVRAERMELKAVAVDLRHAPTLGEPLWLRDQLQRLQLTSKLYDVPSYKYDRHRMVADFPQPDLSNLLKNQES